MDLGARRLPSLVLAMAAVACGRTAPAPTPMLGGKTLPSWQKEFEATDAAVREKAIEDFGNALLDQDSVEPFAGAVAPLVARLSDGSWDVRFTAAWALGLFKRAALDSVEALASHAAEDENAIVRVGAVDALADIAPPPRAYAEAMLGPELLKPAEPDPRPERTAAASSAGLAAVGRCLDDRDETVRKRAVHAIGKWGRHGHSLEARVAPFLKDPDWGTRYVAVVTCRLIGASAEVVLDGLIAIAEEPADVRVPKDPRPTARRAAVALIGDLGAPARPALASLRRLVRDPEVGEAADKAVIKILTAPPR